MPEFKQTLMHVLEAICQQTELVLQHHQAMLDHLLPALCEVVGTTAENGDTRFFCLRMVSEVLNLFLLDAELYGVPSAASQEQQMGIASAAIDQLLTQNVLPLIPQLLKDEDPMPLYALKVGLWGLFLLALIKCCAGPVASAGAIACACWTLFWSHVRTGAHNAGDQACCMYDPVVALCC